MPQSVALASSSPEVRAFRITQESNVLCVKEYYAVGRTERGRGEWNVRGKLWRGGPGSVRVMEPGDVHRDVSRDGPTVFTVVRLPADEIERLREAGKVVSAPHLEAGDARAAAFHRLHDAVCAGADRMALEVALAEAVATFARLCDASSEHTRPVRRAVEYLLERFAEPVTLDALADYAGLDKFHLCRAFRAQIGMPPHAYLTHLRIRQAQRLLSSGVRASDLAPRVGLYDQSQLTRHFRRIVGTTPARYRGK